MILQAAGLAVLAAISPTALLVAAVYLGSARPRLVGSLYLAGAILMSLVMGLVVAIGVLVIIVNLFWLFFPRFFNVVLFILPRFLFFFLILLIGRDLFDLCIVVSFFFVGKGK